MDKKKTINYTGVMRSPTTFKISFWKINLPWTFRLETTVIFVTSVFIIWLLFRVPLAWLNEQINNLDKVIYIGLPYLITVYLMGKETDGLSMWQYIKDFVVFYVTEKIPKKTYCHERETEWLDDEITFSDIYVEKVENDGGSVDETKVTTKNDS